MNLSELELQNLRHLIGGYDTTHCKMQEYAECAQDAKVKQFFERREVCDGEQAGVDGFPALSRGKERNMFEDKTMVADTLAGINGELMRFGEMIPQTENKELKTTLKQFRAACEQSQEELYQIAREKSYYVPAAEATQKEIEHVRNLFSKSSL